MLPYLAAAGHNNYVKSIHIYLQQMQQLEETHNNVYRLFMEGHHVLRRSDRFWAGLSTDLCIEQVLMKSLKFVGGLTRGRGIGETQRTLWLLSMPACGDMTNAMQELTGLSLSASCQHVEAGKLRLKKDDDDLRKHLSFLIDRNTFEGDGTLRSISTGMTADPKVNAENAHDIGQTIISKMIGKSVLEHKFKRVDQAITMDIKSAFKVGGDTIFVDPQLFFQRLITIIESCPERFDLKVLFHYELCSIPPSLFEPSGFLRESMKAEFAKTLLQYDDISHDTKGTSYVIDGGSLLHKIPLAKNESFEQICQRYVDYVD